MSSCRSAILQAWLHGDAAGVAGGGVGAIGTAALGASQEAAAAGDGEDDAVSENIALPVRRAMIGNTI